MARTEDRAPRWERMAILTERAPMSMPLVMDVGRLGISLTGHNAARGKPRPPGSEETAEPFISGDRPRTGRPTKMRTICAPGGRPHVSTAPSLGSDLRFRLQAPAGRAIRPKF